MFPDLSRVKPRNMYQDIVEQVLNLIRGGKIKPGDPLPSERELASILGVGRPTVRSALCVLDTIGAIEIHHGRHTRLAEPRTEVFAGPLSVIFAGSQETFDQIMDFRDIVEPAIAARAAEVAEASHLDGLEKILERHRKEVDSGASGAAEDLEFHSNLVDATNNQVLVQVMRFVLVFTKEVRDDRFQVVGRGRASIEGHRRILDALWARDSQLASESMRQHLKAVQRSIRGDDRERNGGSGR